MNVENEKVEPVTELGLALGYSSQCTQRKLNSDSGAGANAGSRVDMKCANSSFVNKNTSLLWGSGSSNVVLSPSLNITAGTSSTDRLINEEENFITSQSAFHLSNEIAGRNTSGWTPGSSAAVIPDSGSSHEDRTGTLCYLQETNTLVGLPLQHINSKEEIRNGKGECISGPSNVQMAEISEAEEKILSCFPADLCPDSALNKPLSEDPTGGGKDVGSGNQTSRMEIVLASGLHNTKECEANDTFMPNLTFPGKGHEESASFLKKGRKNVMAMTNSLSIHPLEKLESTSENDLRTLFNKNAEGAASRIVVPDSAHEVKNSSQQNEATLPREKTVSDEHYPTNRKMRRYQMKAKEKALSDGDANGRMSKEDDDSNESVESCNSAGLLSTVKNRWSFDQQLIVSSKAVKRQIQQSPGAKSFIKQDSSFMNWIANITKGFSKSNIDDARTPSLALTHACPTYGLEIPDQTLMMYNKTIESNCRNVGFQSIFQSLYCPKSRGEQRALDDGYKTNLEVINGLSDISPIPLACHTDNDNLCKQFLLSNEKFNESSSGEGPWTATRPNISTNFVSGQENSRSVENKNLFNLATNMGEGGTDSNSSLGKRKVSSTENIDAEPPLKVKKTYNFVHGSNPLESLWITRFAPKTSFPLLKLDNRIQSSGGPLECSTNCQKLMPYSQTPISSSNDLKIVESGPHSNEYPPAVVGKELQNSAAETEASSRFNVIKGHNDQKSIRKLNLIAPSSRLKNSEAMATVFARRLDALKHFMPLDVTDSTDCATSSCFFCGRKGHHLRDCSDITDGELEDLLKNINSYNGTEELSCLCIRCFQLNHWAIACPNASLRDLNQLEGNDFRPNEMHLSRNQESTKELDGNKHLAQAAGTHTVCDQDNHQKDTDLEVNHKVNQLTFDRMVCDANLVKHYIASSSRGKKLRENQTMPFGNFVHSCILEEPKGIFDFIKGIRLSRTDILKWMNSHMSLTHLNGFFLRVRLGKWEEGLGGTGYYVACITGAKRENSIQNSKISISVNVGGIKCLVESQYISNQDFLEDELMAWYSATLKSGAKIPSEEDLRLKVEERKILGM